MVLGLEGFWLIVGAALVVAVLRRNIGAVIPSRQAMATTVFAALAVDDVTRSIIYLLPAIPYCVSLLRDEDELTRNRVIAWTIALCIVTPTITLVHAHFGWAYPLPIQVLPS